MANYPTSDPGLKTNFDPNKTPSAEGHTASGHNNPNKEINAIGEDIRDTFASGTEATPAATSSNLVTRIGQILQQIKNITGESNWYDSVSDTISSIVSTISARFHQTTGHQHTGAANDAPQIPTGGIASEAVTPAKVASGIILQAAIATRAAANIQTNSTSYVDVTGLSVTLNNVEEGSDLLILATLGAAAPATKQDNVKFTINIDGTDKDPDATTFQRSVETPGTNLGDWKPHQLSWLEEGVSAGSRTIKVRWLKSGPSASGNVNLGGGVVGSSLIVMELKN